MRRFVVFLMVLCLAAFSAAGQKRRSVGQHSPFEGAVAVWPKSADTWRVTAHGFYLPGFPSFPSTITVEDTVWKPDGELYSSTKDEIFTYAQGAQAMQGPIWEGKIPADWTPGYAVFLRILTIDGHKYRVHAKMAVGLPSDTQVGPLKGYLVDERGGIWLFGPWEERGASPVVVAPHYLNAPVRLARNYIPPGAIGDLPQLIAVCDRIDGNPNDLECSSTVIAPIVAKN